MLLLFSAEALLLLPCLEVLDLSNNKLLARTLENIGSSLSSTPQLRILKMSGCGLNQESLAILGMSVFIIESFNQEMFTAVRGDHGGPSTTSH